MGGHLSCMYAHTSSVNQDNEHHSSSGVLKVVLACEGRACEFSEPVKVAELMLEFPNHFVAEYDMNQDPVAARSLAGADVPVCSRRVSPLPADQDAKLCHVYLILPMHRLNTRLSAGELDLIYVLATAPPTPSPPTISPQSNVTPSYAKAAHTSSKITPLSARDYQEAASHETAAAAAAVTVTTTMTSNVAIAKSYSVPILQLLEEADSEDTDDSKSGNATHQQLHILRSKSWIPKLETIIESSQPLYL